MKIEQVYVEEIEQDQSPLLHLGVEPLPFRGEPTSTLYVDGGPYAGLYDGMNPDNADLDDIMGDLEITLNDFEGQFRRGQPLRVYVAPGQREGLWDPVIAELENMYE